MHKLQRWIVTVVVTAVAPREKLDRDDRDYDPTGRHEVHVTATTEDRAVEAGLTQFHHTIPIASLEDFEIVATARLDPNATLSRDDAIKRWPRIVAHLICESLGYFSPQSAGNALAAWRSGVPNACEWYSHICSCRGKGYFDEQELLNVGDFVLKAAIRNRHDHHGYMAEIAKAKQLVAIERRRPGSTAGMLAGWF